MRSILFGSLIAVVGLIATTGTASAQYGYYGSSYSPYTGIYNTGGSIYYPGAVQSGVTSYSPYTGAFAQTYSYNSLYGSGYSSTYGYSPFYGYPAASYGYSPYAGNYVNRGRYYRR